jgi:V/A-type H+-transporting ATPase subunit I
MLKYTFLVFHKEYNDFLKNIQTLGVVHVLKKAVDVSEEIKKKYDEMNNCNKVIQFLQKRDFAAGNKISDLNANEITSDVLQKQKELEELENKLEETQKLHNKAKPWGNFSRELIEKLQKENIHLHLYTVSVKKYHELEQKKLPIEIISELGQQLLIVLFQFGKNHHEIDAEQLQLPDLPCSELNKQMEELIHKIQILNTAFDNYARYSISKLEEYKSTLINTLNFDNVLLNTSKQADDKLMILEGWIPKSKTIAINQYLEQNSVLYIKRKATSGDKIPVLLKNNRFAKLFEPIGSMFSLPDYAELDLTLFFAPFFMLFFGFCLGDAGYGLLFIVGAGLYKLKAKNEIKPYLTLIQFLGLATIIFGIISGTLFGINLIETDLAISDNYRNLFLNPDKMFNLSLILGGIQIIFGMFIRAINQTKQYGFTYSLATCGWLIIILGSILYSVLTKTEVIPKNKTILYTIFISGGFLVLFFSDPSISILARIGKGVWDVYATITGIFGDLLSYIRLFALGLSSAILGFVINDIGLQILGSSKILGPVFFVIFLLLGHTLNILISSLGSFVHPMRLTFVEFYKNAGFKGGGEEYNPFKSNETSTFSNEYQKINNK